MILVSIEILLYVIGLLIVFIISLTIYLVIQRIIEVNRKRQKNTYIANREDHWYRYFRGEESYLREVFPRALIPQRQYEFEAVEEILLSYVNNITEPPKKETIRRFANLHLLHFYEKQLKSRRWSARMNVLYRIVDFHMDRLLEQCKKLGLQKLSDEERFQLLRIYGLFDTDAFLDKVFMQRSVLSEFEYKKLFANLPTSLFKIVMERIDELPLVGQIAIIDLLGIKRDLELIPYLEEKLKHEQTEIRIRALKAIHEIGIVLEPIAIYPFVTSPIWEERLMVAQILGKIPMEDAFDHLKTLVHDESWWVRSKAAQAIGYYKNGREKLEEIVATSNDRYAIDIANEVLMRGL